MAKVCFAMLMSLVLLFGATAPAEARRTSGQHEYRTRVLINEKRVAHDVRKVRRGPCVNRYAERWARHLRDGGGIWHSNLQNLLERCNAVWAGEILAMGDNRPKRIVRAWMRSDSHRRIMLHKRPRRIGVASVRYDGKWIVVVNFIRH